MGESSQFGIRDMANLLAMRKNNNHHTVLILGTRAGQLFRSAQFYENLLPFSKRNVHQLSRIQQFEECYAILTSGKFGETDLHSILRASLKDIHTIEVDISLASLIRKQYFDEIISTNIDDVLEDALLQTDMRAGRDYEVTRIGRNPPQYEKSCFCRITKLFGELASRDYTVRGRASHLDNAESRSFFQGLLQKDLLIVGMDPTWDRDILRIIPVNTSGTIWFVCEEEEQDIMDKFSFLSDILRTRPATCILGSEGNYDYFVRKLHEYLCGNISPNYPFAHSRTLYNIQDQVDKTAGLLPGIETQIKELIALLLGTHDKLQGLQNDHQAMFGEIQKIKSNLQEIEKKQRDC